MLHATHQEVIDLLRGWLARVVSEDAQAWLTEKEHAIKDGAPDRVLFPAFSSVPRHTRKADLALAPADREAATRACPGFDPSRWSVDQAGRTLLVMAIPPDDVAAYVARLDRLFRAADVGEAVALYQALPLFHHSPKQKARAAEGVRSNMTAVFEAVALDNPYPAAYLDEGAFNQMVLKAFFVGSRVGRIVGLDDRANEALARMLVDYAHERWAASRTIDPELWRPVGPFADDAILDDLEQRVVAASDPATRHAGALALASCPAERAQEILAKHDDLAMAVAANRLSWNDLSRS